MLNNNVIMDRKNKLPKFPDSYLGEKAEEYNNLTWMERNQKRTTLKCVEYLFDKNLGEENDEIHEKSSKIILDLGCGTGFSSEILLQNGFRVIGIDLLIDMLTLATEKKKMLKNNNLGLILSDINYLPLKISSIDHVISVSAYNFITHNNHGLREKRKTLNNTAKYLNKLLKKNGRAIIELYPESDEELDLFASSFTNNGFKGFKIKDNPNQKSGKTFLLLKKTR